VNIKNLLFIQKGTLQESEEGKKERDLRITRTRTFLLGQKKKGLNDCGGDGEKEASLEKRPLRGEVPPYANGDFELFTGRKGGKRRQYPAPGKGEGGSVLLYMEKKPPLPYTLPTGRKKNRH